MALLSFRGISTSSLKAQGEQRRSSLFNIPRDNPVISDNRPAGAELCQDMTSTVRFIRPSAIQIAEYWDRDRAFPVTPTPAGLGFDAALGDAFRDAVRGLLTQAAGGEGAQLELDPVAAALNLPAGYDAAWRLVQCLENHRGFRQDGGDERKGQRHPDRAPALAFADGERLDALGGVK